MKWPLRVLIEGQLSARPSLEKIKISAFWQFLQLLSQNLFMILTRSVNEAHNIFHLRVSLQKILIFQVFAFFLTLLSRKIGPQSAPSTATSRNHPKG